jgi:7-cyano-7-deazaguanine reductase
MWSYREEGAFHEKVTNTMLDDFVKACYTTVVAEHRAADWNPPQPVTLP